MKYLYCVLILLLNLASLQGQSEELSSKDKKKYARQDMVSLKTGKIMWGEIQFYELGKEMLFRDQHGVMMRIPAEMIDKFVAGAHTTNVKQVLRPEKPFLEAKSIYQNLALFFPFGVKTTANSRTGLGIEYSIGWQATPKVGLGLGTGMNFMFGTASDRLVPIVAEVRYYTNPEHQNRFYALLDSGYALGWSADQINDAYRFKGGWRIHPAIGVAWHNASTTRFTTEFGFWHQRATLVEDWWEASRWRRENDYKLNRWLLKMGLTF